MVSEKSGRFFCLAVRLAEYFGCNERSIRRAFKELEQTGFFELVSRSAFETNLYKPVDHKSWADKHPGKCIMRWEFPWSQDSNKLGQVLWSVSGGQAPIMRHHVEFLQKLGLDDEYIVSEFAAFWPMLSRIMRADRDKSGRSRIVGLFLMNMKEKADSLHVA